MKTQKTTNEIRVLLKNAKLDFDSIVNMALNDYLARIFHSCPFTEEVCTSKQCVECEVFVEPQK
jgi:xanthine dehydrogenase iron-sulfur cluster and FAD-binding subunit A